MEAKYREVQAQGCDVVPRLKLAVHEDHDLTGDAGAFAGLLQLGRSGLGQKQICGTLCGHAMLDCAAADRSLSKTHASTVLYRQTYLCVSGHGEHR